MSFRLKLKRLGAGCVKVVDWSLIMVSQWHAYHEFVKNKMQRQLLKKEAVKVVI